MLHLLFHTSRINLSIAKSTLSYMQKEISFQLFVQMVFYQSEFQLSSL